MMLMQHLAINRTGAYRKETLNGREHYVVPVAMITPGVLKGSKGALYYPPEEIVKNYDAWNGMPLVVNHPTIDGRAVSARTPSVLESHGIGTVLNSRINKNGKLVAEGWFDVEKTRKIDPRILNWIEQGSQIELSTGLFTDNIPVKNAKDAVYNGKQYTHIARNYRPDHLAILPDELGACSIKDGCGVGVLNASTIINGKKNKKCPVCGKPAKSCPCNEDGGTNNASSMRKEAQTGCRCTKASGGCKCSATELNRQAKAEHKAKTGETVRDSSPEKEPTENELSYSELGPALEKELSSRFPGSYINEIFRDYTVFRYAGSLYQIGYSVDKKTDMIALDSEMPTQVRRVTSFKPVQITSNLYVTNTEAAKLIINESWFKICPRKNGRCLPKSAAAGGKGTGAKGKGKEPAAKKTTKKKTEVAPKSVAGEPVTPPSTMKPSLADTIPKKGKPAKAARVGVSGDEVPPPPKITKLPNLTKSERKVEREFINAYEKDPDGMANKLRKVLKKGTKPGEPLTFGTDDAKVLHKAWGNKKMSLEDRSKNRATLNCALHQTANAVTKRAFVQHLNTLKKGDEIMVTVGGCGAGKGYALKNVPKALELKKKSKAVWDSAGDQNATENTWIQKEAEKRGLKVNYVFVDADPKVQWAHPDRGVVKRAQDPNDGRMVDAKVFADSYAHGSKNHQAFYEKNKNNKNANFIFLENGANPREIPGIPKKRLRQSAKKLADFAIETVAKNYEIPPHVRRGATIGTRIWPEGLTANSMTLDYAYIVNAQSEIEFDDSEDYNEELDRLNSMSDFADESGFQVDTDHEPMELDENGVEITDDDEEEVTDNSSDPLYGLSDTTKARLILTYQLTDNVFSDEARAAALLARKRMGQAGSAVKDAGKKAIVSGIKAAGGAAKAGLKRTGQAYKDVAKELLTRLKNKLGIGMSAGNGKKKSQPTKPVKMAKDRTKEKQTSKERYQARLAKIESRLKARRDAKAAKKSANAQRRELKSKVKKNASAIKSRSRQNEASGKRPLTEPKTKTKSSSKSKTVSKGSNKKKFSKAASKSLRT